MTSNALQLGPLLLPYALLLVMASLGAAFFVGGQVARRAPQQGGGVPQQADTVLWQAALLGLAVARLAFVLQYRSDYLGAPLAVLDIRDGGWNAAAGFVAAWLYALARLRLRPALGRPVIAALFTGTAVFALGAAGLWLRPASQQQHLPALALASVDGSRVHLHRYIGSPTVVNLWATWCPPCVREMPVLQQAQREHADVNFVFLNQGESAAHVQAWLAGRKLELNNVLIDEQRAASTALRQGGYPTTLFFNRQGQLVSIRTGELSAATLRERLRLVSGR